MLSLFFLLSFSQPVSSLQTRSENFPAFWGCERVFGRESTYSMSSVVFISFHHLSCCINFLSCSFHFAIIPFMLHSFPFILLSCPFIFRSGGYPPKHSRVCHISLSFWLSFSYRFGGLCRLPSQASWTCTYMSALSCFFLLSFSGPATHWHCLKCKLS